MKEKKELKIKFKTAVMLIIILLIVIVSIIAIIIKKEQSKLKNDTTVTITKSDKQQVIDTDFATQFLKLENANKNMVYSPLSIKYALKMLNEGANGNTCKRRL